MNKKTLVEIHNTTTSEFLEEFSNILDEKLRNLKINKKNKITLLSRKNCGIFFGVSVVTIDEWTRKGLIIAYRKGNRKYYKLEELEQSLTQINNKNEEE